MGRSGRMIQGMRRAQAIGTLEALDAYDLLPSGPVNTRDTLMNLRYVESAGLDHLPPTSPLHHCATQAAWNPDSFPSDLCEP
jgi:hypothetical protein